MFALSAAGMRTFSPGFAPTYWTRLACRRNRVAHRAWFAAGAASRIALGLPPEPYHAPRFACVRNRTMHRGWLAFGAASRIALGLPPEPHCAPRSSATFLILEYLISKERYSSFTFIKSTPKMHFRNQTKKADDAREERQPPEGGTPTALEGRRPCQGQANRARDGQPCQGQANRTRDGQPC